MASATKIWVLLLLGALLVASCQVANVTKRFKPASPSNADLESLDFSSTIRIPRAHTEVSFTITPDVAKPTNEKDLNRFHVRITRAGGDGPIKIIRRTETNQEVKVIGVFKNESQSLEDRNVSPESTYLYDIQALDSSDQVKETFPTRITVPNDFFLSGNICDDGVPFKKAFRIYLAKDLDYATLGNRIDWEAKELISEVGAHFRVFPADERRSRMCSVRHSPLPYPVDIRVKRAAGTLYFYPHEALKPGAKAADKSFEPGSVFELELLIAELTGPPAFIRIAEPSQFRFILGENVPKQSTFNGTLCTALGGQIEVQLRNARVRVQNMAGIYLPKEATSVSKGNELVPKAEEEVLAFLPGCAELSYYSVVNGTLIRYWAHLPPTSFSLDQQPDNNRGSLIANTPIVSNRHFVRLHQSDLNSKHLNHPALKNLLDLIELVEKLNESLVDTPYSIGLVPVPAAFAEEPGAYVNFTQQDVELARYLTSHRDKLLAYFRSHHLRSLQFTGNDTPHTDEERQTLYIGKDDSFSRNFKSATE